MPRYDYHCENCGKTFEVVQKITDAPLADCMFCAGTVRKLISAPGILFKGSGWYVTDYPSRERKKAMEAENKKTAPVT